MNRKILYFTFALILSGVVVFIGCRKENITDTEMTINSEASTEETSIAELSLLDPSLQNVPDFSHDKDMIEFTKVMDESRDFNRAVAYKSLRTKTALKKPTIPKNASRSDLKNAYLNVGRGEEFEKLSTTIDKQAALAASFIKRHPELNKLNKDGLSLIFLKVFKLNQIRSRKRVSIYRKVQEAERAKCMATLDNDTELNDQERFNELAGATAALIIAESACLLAGPGYPLCALAASATYAIAAAVIEANWTANEVAIAQAYAICMDGLTESRSAFL